MKCPQCQHPLAAWPWMDGGYRGVQCLGCDQRWWSPTFELAASEAERRALEALMLTSEFPTDAATNEDQQKRWSKELCNGVEPE